MVLGWGGNEGRDPRLTTWHGSQLVARADGRTEQANHRAATSVRPPPPRPFWVRSNEAKQKIGGGGKGDR